MSRSTDFPGRTSGATSRAGRSLTVDSNTIESAPARRARIGRSSSEERDWGRLAAFGSGIALGVALGVGAALLFAPQSGEETREMLGGRARALGGRFADRWDDARDELRWLARRGRKRMRRGLTRGRWAAEDVAERGRRRFVG